MRFDKPAAEVHIFALLDDSPKKDRARQAGVELVPTQHICCVWLCCARVAPNTAVCHVRATSAAISVAADAAVRSAQRGSVCRMCAWRCALQL